MCVCVCEREREREMQEGRKGKKLMIWATMNLRTVSWLYSISIKVFLISIKFVECQDRMPTIYVVEVAQYDNFTML